MVTTEATELIGIPLILPHEGQAVEWHFSQEDLLRVDNTDYNVVGNLIEGGEGYIRGIADYYRNRWQAHLLGDGLEYAEAVRRAGHYAVGQHEHLHEATRIGTLRLPQMDNLAFMVHVEQVAEAGSRVRSLRG